MDLFGQPVEPARSTARARKATVSTAPSKEAPLADRMRPRTLDEIVGQEHLLGTGRVLRSAIETGQLHSMILWGPPGSGKTTLASLIRGWRAFHGVLCRTLGREGDPGGHCRG